MSSSEENWGCCGVPKGGGEKPLPEIKEDYIESDYTGKEALLDLAHQDGLHYMDIEVLQLPSEENNNTAVFKAEIHTRRGVFLGIGDANPQNARRAKKHFIRVAATRAWNRAIGKAVNEDQVSYEETSEVDEVSGDVDDDWFEE